MRDLTGIVLAGTLHLEALLGSGGQAAVYRARDLHTRYQVAVKVLNPDFSEDRVALRRFTTEAQLLQKLRHPGIVPFLGFQHDQGLAYIVMGFIDGTDLRHLIFKRDASFTATEALPYVQPVAAALAHAHSQGVVHRDIKPANILVDRMGRVFVSDFGIARVAEVSTMTQGAIGTPAYMSPEQIRQQTVDARSDIYSFGIVLYEMFTLTRPFIGDQASPTMGSEQARVIWEQLCLDPMPPSLHNPQIDLNVERVILRCLQKNPNDRYQSMMEVSGALRSSRPVEWGHVTNRSQRLNRVSPPVPAPVYTIQINFDTPPESRMAVAVPVPAPYPPVPPQAPPAGEGQAITLAGSSLTEWLVGGSIFSILALILIFAFIYLGNLVSKPPAYPPPTNVPVFTAVPPDTFTSVPDIIVSPLPTGLPVMPTKIEGPGRVTVSPTLDPIIYGTGPDLEIILSWSTTDDLDLVVIDPLGVRHTSQTGDMNADCENWGAAPTERVSWQVNKAAAGIYTIEVYYAESCSGETSIPFQVSVRISGKYRPAYSGAAQSEHQTYSGGNDVNFTR